MALNDENPSLSVKTVISAADFSEYSENAGRYAALLAAQYEASLLVAHVFAPTTAALEAEMLRPEPSVQRRELEWKLAARARALSTDRLRAEPILLTGDPRQKLPELAEQHAPSMIVLGTHGRGRLGRTLLGSVAEEILRSTRWPVLTANTHTGPVNSDAPFRRILYATDLSPAAARAAPFALAFARCFSADLDVLHVLDPGSRQRPAQLAADKERFQKALGNLTGGDTDDFCNPTAFVEAGPTHERILDHIEKHAIDLMILGLQKTAHVHLRIRLSRTFDLILKAPCPTLTITG